MAAMSYRHLADAELIKYAMDGEPVDSLAHLIASRYEDNITDVADFEESQTTVVDDLERHHAEELSALQDDLERHHAEELSALQDDVDTGVKRIMWLEAALDRALLK
jgi:hypothetical protein